MPAITGVRCLGSLRLGDLLAARLRVGWPSPQACQRALDPTTISTPSSLPLTDGAYAVFQHLLAVYPRLLDDLPPETARLFFEGQGTQRRLRGLLMPELRRQEEAVHRCDLAPGILQGFLAAARTAVHVAHGCSAWDGGGSPELPCCAC